MRRHLRKLLLGGGLFIIISPFECTFFYCERHSFNPPICDLLLPG